MDLTYDYPKQVKSLKKGHNYTIIFTKEIGEYSYTAHILRDNTIEEELDEWINYSSEASIKKHFKDVTIIRLGD